jgi:hypothetical protein
MKKVIIPNSPAQHNQWVEKLNAAGASYSLVDVQGRVGIELTAQDAASVLGIGAAKPAPKKTTMPLWARLSIFAVIGLSLVAIFSVGDEAPDTAPAPAEEVQPDSATLRRQSIEAQFSSWDGSHIAVTRSIKKSMNDPKSYDHVETTYADRGDYIQVRTRFRGKNAFGGVVINTVNAKVSLQGQVLDISLEE